MIYPNRSDVERFFISLSSRWSVEVNELNGRVEYEISKGDKSAVYCWDPKKPEEIWYTLRIGKLYEYEGWTEIFENEMKDVYFNYFQLITERYLEYVTRIRKRWILFGNVDIQYKTNGKWRALRKPT